MKGTTIENEKKSESIGERLERELGRPVSMAECEKEAMRIERDGYKAEIERLRAFETFVLQAGDKILKAFEKFCFSDKKDVGQPQVTTSSRVRCPRCGHELAPFKGGKYTWWCYNCHVPTDESAPACHEKVPNVDREGGVQKS